MKMLRKITASVLGIISMLWLVLGLFYTLDSGALIDHTIEKSRIIEASFDQCVAYVEQFRQSQSRLPSTAEFADWASQFPARPYTPHGMRLETSDFSAEVQKEFGAPSPNSYLLVMWRGEWEEYYASWAKRSSLVFDKRKYYAFGNKYVDSAAVVCLGGLFLFFAFKLWPNNALNTPDHKASPRIS